MCAGKMISSVLMVCLFSGLPAWADDLPIEPDLGLSTAWCEFSGPDPVVVINFPNGEGRRFDEARTSGGVVNGTIHLMLLDGMGVPINDYPREDIWLESVDGGAASCLQGSIADANTDVNGETSWVNPLMAGGYSEANTDVIINGSPLFSLGLNVHFNSPDINVDGVVNLTDVAMFSQDFFGWTYQFRSDFHYDGIVNLSDLAILGEGLGASCP